MTSFVNLLSTLILLDQLRPVILLERARKAQNLPAAGQVHDAIARSWRIRTELLLHHCIKMLDTSLRDTGLPADDHMTTISLRHICKNLFHRLSGSMGTLYGCKPVRASPIKWVTILLMCCMLLQDTHHPISTGLSILLGESVSTAWLVLLFRACNKAFKCALRSVCVGFSPSMFVDLSHCSGYAQLTVCYKSGGEKCAC